MNDMTLATKPSGSDDREPAIREAPLEMPVQPLWRDPHAVEGEGLRQNWRARLIMMVMLGMTLGATAVFVRGQYGALALQNGGTPLHYLFLTISTLAFAWIAFGAANAVVGAVALLLGRGLDTIEAPSQVSRLQHRTALLFPVYHEDPQAVAEGIVQLNRELSRLGVTRHFDVFVLSDSQSDTARAAEAAVFGPLRASLVDGAGLVYRNRSANVGKKAGNIADWVKTYGGGYEHFIVFDADSVIASETIVRLVAAMDANPDTGLIQTVPRLRGAETVFGYLQQLANNLHGPVSAAGFAAWQDATGNYWGHNAVIRTRAFASSAGLPTLEGRAPFGGHIQSHDFVEAAMLRRAGWRVALITSIGGSYEGGPPTIVEMVARDRRWMQGNLQHLAVLCAKGFAPISRLHLSIGILAYLSSALWAAMLSVGLYLMWQEENRLVSYFKNDKSLFPNWPTFDLEAGLRVLTGTMIIVFLPKILGLFIALVRAVRRRMRPVQVVSMLGGWGVEIVISALWAPVLMLLQVRGLIEILIGRDSGWKPQRRNRASISPAEALRFHAVHVTIGLALGAFCISLSWPIFAWMSPVVAGLVLSPLLTWYTSRSANGMESLLLADPFAPASLKAPSRQVKSEPRSLVIRLRPRSSAQASHTPD